MEYSQCDSMYNIIILGVNKMTKGQDKKKEAKKEPTHKSIKEKRAAKNAKKAAK